MEEYIILGKLFSSKTIIFLIGLYVSWEVFLFKKITKSKDDLLAIINQNFKSQNPVLNNKIFILETSIKSLEQENLSNKKEIKLIQKNFEEIKHILNEIIITLRVDSEFNKLKEKQNLKTKI